MSTGAEQTSDTLASHPEIERRLMVRVPGSTSNLGPGFDTLGLALQIYNTVTFNVLKKNDPAIPLISWSGSETMPESGTVKRIPLDETNHIYKIVASHLRGDSELLSRLRITIQCAIPIGSGLGSSGTATLAALWAAQMLKTGEIEARTLLADATKVEGHPDNVSPSLFGGFTTSVDTGGERGVIVQNLKWPDEWESLFVVPMRQLETAKARAALPASVSLKDAVHNVQRVSLLLAAIAQKDEEALSYALDDRLHEPYRASLVPELGELKKLASGAGALGVTLSGAGPTVMIWVSSLHREYVFETVRKWAGAQEANPHILRLSVDRKGLKSLHE
jgi:homoserine kinase